MIQHPFDEAIKVSEPVEKAMRMTLEEGPERVLEKRVEAMRWMKRRARELESEEKKLHAMPEWRAKVVKGKKFLLFKELVDLVGHLRDLVSGMRITGNAEPTQKSLWWTSSQRREKDLWQIAKFLKRK